MDEGAAVLRKLAIRRVARLSGERSAWLTSDSSHATLSQCKVTAVTSSSHPPREHELKKKIIAVMAVGATSMLVLPAMPASAVAKAGQSCKKLGEVKDGLVCTAKGKKRVYAAAPVTTVPATVAPGASTPATAPAGHATVPGFDGKTINVTVLGNVSVSACRSMCFPWPGWG